MEERLPGMGSSATQEKGRGWERRERVGKMEDGEIRRRLRREEGKTDRGRRHLWD